MKEKLKAFWGKTKELTGKVSKKVYIIAAVVLVVLAAAIVVFLNSRPYATLITDVSPTEASTVLNLLNEWGVTDYRMEGQDTILVPESQVETLKVRLLMENVTVNGHYYSTYFDKISSISTEAERNAAYLDDTAEHLRATIMNIENVRDAEVFLNPGEDQSYILAQNRKINASASVQVTMKPGTKLSTSAASAIQTLVKNAIAGLEVENVSIMDTIGNHYSGGDLTDSDASALKMQLEEETSNRIRTQVMQALSNMYGEENVDVAVNCVVEVDDVTEDQTLYTLPEYAQDGGTYGRGIIGSELWGWNYVRDGETPVGGIVGTTTNSVVPDENFSEYVENIPPLDGTESEANGSGQIDYRTDTSQRHIMRTAGVLKDCSIAVSINSDVAGNVDVETIRQHTARAAGIVGTIDEETGQEDLSGRISVISAPFYRPVIVGPDPVRIFGIFEPWMLIAAGAGLLLFLIILIVVLVLLRRRRRKRLAQEEAENAENDDITALLAAAGISQEAPAGADVMNMQSERSMELRKDIRQFASDNPEIAAQMIRNWLKGGEENG